MQSTRVAPFMGFSTRAWTVAVVTVAGGCLNLGEGGASDWASVGPSTSASSTAGGGGGSATSSGSGGSGGGGLPGSCGEALFEEDFENGTAVRCDAGSAAVIRGGFDSSDVEDSYKLIVTQPTIFGVETFESPAKCDDLKTKIVIRDEDEVEVLSDKGSGAGIQECASVTGYLNEGNYSVLVKSAISPSSKISYLLHIRAYSSSGFESWPLVPKKLIGPNTFVVGVVEYEDDVYEVDLGPNQTLRAEVLLTDPTKICEDVKLRVDFPAGPSVPPDSNVGCPIIDGSDLPPNYKITPKEGLARLVVGESTTDSPSFQYYLVVTARDAK